MGGWTIRLPQRASAEGGKRGVAGDEGEVFDLGLGGEEAVERIAVGAG